MPSQFLLFWFNIQLYYILCRVDTKESIKKRINNRFFFIKKGNIYSMLYEKCIPLFNRQFPNNDDGSKVNNNNGKLKKGKCGLTRHSLQYKRNKKKYLLHFPFHRLLESTLQLFILTTMINPDKIRKSTECYSVDLLQSSVRLHGLFKLGLFKNKRRQTWISRECPRVDMWCCVISQR